MMSPTPSDIAICIPIQSNHNQHYLDSECIGLVLYRNDGQLDFINYSHPDAPTSTREDITFADTTLILNKKFALNIGIRGGIDMDSYLLYYFDYTIPLSSFYCDTINSYHRKHRNSKNLNRIVPYSKLMESIGNFCDHVIRLYKPDRIASDCVSFCNDYVDAFYGLDKSIVIIDDIHRRQHYTWNTATTRPSNHWDRLNFYAINKGDGSRDRLKTQFDNGTLVQFDFNAFHVNLLANYVGFSFDKYPYEQLRDEIHPEMSINDMKRYVFKNLYGGISDDMKRHQFFSLVQDVIDAKYSEYSTHFCMKSWRYGKRFRDIQDANPNKVFNYFLQSMETEWNVPIIIRILKLFGELESKFLMYLWDAFLFDIHPNEKWVIPEISSILGDVGMKLKITSGGDFGNLT